MPPPSAARRRNLPYVVTKAAVLAMTRAWRSSTASAASSSMRSPPARSSRPTISPADLGAHSAELPVHYPVTDQEAVEQFGPAGGLLASDHRRQRPRLRPGSGPEPELARPASPARGLQYGCGETGADLLELPDADEADRAPTRPCPPRAPESPHRTPRPPSPRCR